MRLKKILAALFLSLSICMTAVTVVVPPITTEAHSGRTDSQGGHKDNKNQSGLGSYHYHHGYPAHLHTGGVCPYANGVEDEPSSSAANSAVDQTVIISDTSYDNAAFNASYYANANKDVYNVYGDDAKSLYNHFISSGIKEGRQSSEQFSILIYKENNQDLIEAFGDDLIKYYNHFIECGVNENRVSK